MLPSDVAAVPKHWPLHACWLRTKCGVECFVCVSEVSLPHEMLMQRSVCAQLGTHLRGKRKREELSALLRKAKK